MEDIIKKGLLLGLGAAALIKDHAEKIVKNLVRKNAVTVKEGAEMLEKIRNEALNESRRIRKLAEKESKRIAGKLSIMPKAKIEKVRKSLKSIDTELSSKGKKALKEILRQLSK